MLARCESALRRVLLLVLTILAVLMERRRLIHSARQATQECLFFFSLVVKASEKVSNYNERFSAKSLNVIVAQLSCHFRGSVRHR